MRKEGRSSSGLLPERIQMTLPHTFPETRLLTDAELEQLKIETRARNSQLPSLAQKFTAIVGQTGLMSTFPILIDVSSYQADPVTHMSGVDVDALEKRSQFKGMIWKLGEVGARGFPNESGTETDNWMDQSYKSNCEKMEKYPRLFKGSYIYHNSTWYVDRGIGEGAILNNWKGIDESAVANNLLSDPNTWLIVRRLKSMGRQFTAEQVKAKSLTYTVDMIAIDFEKWYDNRGLWPGDHVLAFALNQTILGLLWLMAHGYLPTIPIRIYSSEWFLRQYANVEGRGVLDRYSTWAAGYYWNNVIVKTTFEGIVTALGTIPNSWHPTYIGAGIPGERVSFLQISGDHFTIPEVCSSPGRVSAVDINVYNGSDASMLGEFPEWAKRQGVIIPPPPPPPPPPVTEKKYWATLKTGITQLNMRNSPEVIPSTVILKSMKPLQPIKVEIVDTPTIKWAKGEVYFAIEDKVKGETYIDLTEIPE
jgi:hypothetical protein